MKLYYLILILTIMGKLDSEVWLETTQEDFKDGEYERNLYTSHRKGGAVEFVPRFDFNTDGYLDLLTTDYFGGSTIYWGSSSGFSSENRTHYSIGWGGGDFADLNLDGYSDYVATAPLTIYWGNKNGPNPDSSISLVSADDAEACFITDLNKDGYLDIVVDLYSSSDSSCIYWGSAKGYSSSHITTLPCIHAQHNIEVADLNKDGWFDIVIINQWADRNYIYWGSENKYSPDNRTELEYLTDTPHGCSVADLNKDGYLDLVFTGNYQVHSSYIYWGSSSGFKNRQVLNTDESYGGSSIADLNNDGYLDIVFFRGTESHYHPLIYWGSVSGYSDSNRDSIGPALRASGGYIADLNYDSNLDIFVNGFDGESYILWGHAYSDFQALPVGVDHHAFVREVGNVYDRSYKEGYISSVFDAGYPIDWGIVGWEDSTPLGSEVNLQLRSGNTETPDDSWVDWTAVENGSSVPEFLNSRYIQYRAIFTYTNPAYLPILFEVWITYGIAEAGIIVEPDQTGNTKPRIPKEYDLWVINMGKHIDVADMRITKNSPSWEAEIRDSTGINPLLDTDKDGIPDTGPLDSLGGKRKLKVRVTPPSDVLFGEVDTTVVKGTSSLNPLVSDTATLITKIEAMAGIIIEPDQTDTISPGEAKSYTLSVINTGNAPDVANIVIQKTLKDWKAEVYDSTGRNKLKDHNRDRLVDVDTLPPSGGRKKIIVRVIPPKKKVPDWTSGLEEVPRWIVDTTVVYAYSSLNPAVRDSAVLLTVLGPSLAIHNYKNPFAENTHFVFTIPADGKVNLYVYSQAGEHVKTICYGKEFEIGRHTIPWDGKDEYGRRIPPGIYLYLFKFESKEKGGKIIKRLMVLPLKER